MSAAETRRRHRRHAAALLRSWLATYRIRLRTAP